MRLKKLSSYEKLSDRTTVITKRILLTTIVLAALSFLAFWIRLSFWFELFAVFAPQIMFVTMSLLFLAFAVVLHKVMSEGWKHYALNHKKLSSYILVVLALITHNFYMTINQPLYAETNRESDSNTIRIMTLNKRYDNPISTQLTNYITSRQPDVLAVQEIFKDEAKTLASEIGYTHWHIASCGCSAYGSDLALFSKFPLKNVDISFEDRLGGFLRGEVELGHGDYITVYVAHVAPPYSSLAYKIRPQMLEKLADEISGENNRVIVAGDFNSPMTTIDMRNLSNNVQDKIRVVGESPMQKCSWFGYSEVLCSRIDHVFIPVTSHVVESKIGPYLGSDHRAVDVDISI